METLALRPALQSRSRRTLGNLAAAALRLLREEDFETLQIGRIAAEAGASVSSFYARFPAKDDFLIFVARHLLLDQIGPSLNASLSPDAHAKKSLEQRILASLTEMARTFSAHRNVLRPLTLIMHSSGGERARTIAAEFNAPLHAAFRTLVLASPEMSRRKLADAPIRDALDWMGASLRQVWLLRDAPGETEEKRVLGELARCMALYLHSKAR